MFEPMSRWLRSAVCGLILSSSVHAANPPPTQVFYVPFPEDNQLSGFAGINGAAVDPLAVFVTFSAATDNTVIYYDHWEDGYEKDITNPTQSTTLVFGDGNPANGYPPGNAGDLIPAGTVFSLRNYVQSTTLQSVMDYDARDKVASYKPISLTKTCFPASTNTLMAGCVEVFEQGLWGTEYRVPVGVDMPTTTPTAALTNDADMFGYTALSIMAGAKASTVQIDADNNGAFEQTLNLSEGQTAYVSGVNSGGRVVSDNPVQVVLFCGRPGSNYQSRDTSLLPTYRWSSSYYAPVSTSSTYGTCVFLYNPGASAITVSYDYRSSTSGYTTATVSVPAGGNARVNLSPASGTTHYGAYHFYTTGGTPPVFYAFCAVDGTSTSTGSNQAYDGGFTLVGQPSLTTQVLVSLGIGRDPYSSTNPTENGNPVWVTTVGNGHTAETVYVDYNGDNAGPNTDPNGNKYDVSYSVRELEQMKIFDSDGDQSGMLVYTLNPSVKLAAAWAQDPTAATASQPGLDVSTLLPPVREGEGGKKSNLSIDSDGDGAVSAGDTLEYDIRGANSARASIPGPFKVTDNLPSDVNYVAGSTRYRFTVSGNWQAWVSIPDDGSGTAFPLDGAGYSVPGNLGMGQQLQVTFSAAIKPQNQLSSASITNTGSVEISPYGLVLPINWTDTIYGSIGDRVWIDADGDGVQDAGENGLAGIDVFLDSNNNGIWDTGEKKSTTDANGNYLLSGLEAGTYTVRVDAADIAAANVGYGTTYDVDGITTSNVATVTLTGAQDRVDVDFGYRIGASVGDRVWMDRDGDGVQENGEPGINGLRVYLDLNSNGSWNSNEPNAITFGDGNYYIGNLSAGTYSVKVDTSTLPSGSTQTFDLNGALDHAASVTLISAEHRPDLDFGYRGNLSIGDLVWEDLNADGAVSLVSSTNYTIINGRVDINNDGSTNGSDDGFIGSMRIINGYADIDNDNATPVDNDDDGSFLGLTVVNGGFDVDGSGTISNSDDGSGVYQVYETGIANVRVYIDMDNDGVFDATEPSAVTNSTGGYSITGLYNGTFTVRVDTSTVPSSYVQTYDLTSPVTDSKATIVLSGASRTDVDFGYRNDATLGDTVWNDRNANGVRDAGEPGIEGVIVYIDADGDNVFDQGVERHAITDISGFYQIPNLAAGTYTVRVEFSTLPQGCTQTYDLDATLDHETNRTLTTSENAVNVDFGYRASASFGNFVWNDADADGVQDVGEAGINGVRVYLDINGNGTFDNSTEPSATTDAAGAYTIGNLLPGIFTARVDATTLPANYVQTYDLEGALDHSATFSLSAAQARTDIDFGYSQRVSLGDFVWNDANANGQQDLGETGIPGVIVTAFNAGNDTIAGTATTDSNGNYSFILMPGTYYLVFDAPAGYARTLADQGADATDSDGSAAAGRTANVTLTSGQSNVTLDAGFYQPASIGDFVWNDANANGQQDGGETGLNGVSVTLYRPGFGPDGIAGNGDDATAVATTTTAGGGAYGFTGLRPGTYQVQFGTLSGYNRTLADQGADATDSDANAGTGLTATFAIAAGATNNTIDAGYYQPASIGDFVWNDTNANGQQDGGETGINGVSVTLYRPGFGPDGIAGNGDDATAVATTTTAGGGSYSFTGLRPGTYQVTFGALVGYNRTLADQGADATDSDANASTGATATFAIAAGATNNTIDAGYFQPATIGDFVWNDANANGQQDVGETGLNGVSVTLYRPGFGPDGIAGNADDATAVATTTTAGGGAYSFTGLRPGTYQVTFGALAGYNRSLADQGADATDSDANAGTGATATFAIAAGATNNTIDAGYYQPATIGDFVWNDANANGQQDVGETGLNGVSVTLFRPGFGPDGIAGNADDATAVATTTTAGGGAYSITGLRPGTYQVQFGTYAGFVRTLVDQGADASDSDANVATGLTATFAVAAGATNNTLDAGFYQPGTVFGHLYIDTNGNGTQDSGEPDLANVNVVVTDVNGAIQTVSTDASGDWTAAVPPGSTTANVDETDPQYPTGYTQTEGNDPTTVTAVSGANVDAGNDGYFLPGVISGSVLADTDNDNLGNTGIPGVTLTLVDSAGNPVDGNAGLPGVQPITTTTASNGSYSFTNLPPGTYGVLETQPSGYRSVSDRDGGNPDEIRPITVTAGATNSGNDFTEEQPGSISGQVMKDTDGDNDADDPLSGVVLRLLNSSGNPVFDGFGQPVTATTDVNGNYSFSALDPGSYQISQDQPSNYNSVSDTDGANNNRIGDQTPVVVSAGQNNGGNDFLEIELGVISGYVRTDDDNNGSGDTGLGGVVLNLLDGSGNPVLDGLGAPIQVSTNASGFYQFTLVPVGTYRVSQNQPAGYASVSDVDGANNNVVGDETPIVMTPGLVVANRNFVEVAYGAISGSVLADVDDDGDGEGPLANVTLTLLDGSGNPVDGNPGLPGVQLVTTTTNSLGGYRFDNLLPGTYQVSETQPSGYGSVTDSDAGNPNLIGNITPITVNPGQEVGLRDFIEIELCTISGYVYAGTTPMGGVTLTLLDENGDPVDGDPDTPGVQPVTTVTDGSGFYQFGGVRPGIYQVGQTQPYGYDSFGDIDGGDINIIGDVTPITLLPGQNSLNNNFVETLDTCPDDWAHWKFLHPSETPSGNPDQDAYDNFAEFAFAMPHDDGTGSTWLDHTAWIIRPSTLAPGTLEGVFIRHKGAPTNVVYTLQYAANAGNPTFWQSLTITPAMITTVDNGDCTETVTIHDLETLTGLTGGKGVVRIQADLDDDGGNDEVDHTSHTEPEGWTETPLELCCRTYNNPYLRESVFTGTVSGVSGQTLTFAVSGGSVDLADLLTTGAYFLEVTSGGNEGHRFDISSATGNTVTLASDSNLESINAPYNTKTGAPPSDLTGDTVAIRRHWTLDEVFPPSGFGATGSQSTADQVQVFAGGAWTIYWLYDENDGNPATARWVDAADGGMADQGAHLIPPGQGVFFNNRSAVTSILSYGEVRTNDFIRPLGAGNNLVGGGFPVDQSANSALGRAMNPTAGFYGSLDFKTADSFFIWRADTQIGLTGYDSYYLLNGAPIQPSLLRWVKVGDASAAVRDSETLLLRNRSAFVRSKNGVSAYKVPSPWVP